MGVEWEFRVSRYKLVHIEWINNKFLLYSIGNYIRYPGINHNGKAYEKEYICVCVCVSVTESLSCMAEINTAL